MKRLDQDAHKSLVLSLANKNKVSQEASNKEPENREQNRPK